MQANKPPDSRTRILVAEDDPNLGTILSDYLQMKGYEVHLARNGAEGIRLFRSERFDCCLLDVMMPEKDGFTLAKEIRAENASVPIIFLTAKSMKEDTITGFKAGGDDYITKPFSMEELLQRLKAILRRTMGEKTEPEKTTQAIGNMVFDFKNQILKTATGEQRLTSKETALLKLMVQHSNQLLDRSHALIAIWGDDTYYNSRSMDVYVAKIRKYLRADERVQILNEHGKGFTLMLPK